MKIVIPIHSFIDLITNSSTETYVHATDKTVKATKELIKTLLDLGGSTLNVDDVFDIKLKVASYEYVEQKDDYENVNHLFKTEKDAREFASRNDSNVISQELHIEVNKAYEKDALLTNVIEVFSKLANSYETGTRMC